MTAPRRPDPPVASAETDPTSTPTWKIFAFPAVAAILGYLALYSCDARLRDRRGPWEVAFLQESNGTPALRIDQPSLGIRNVLVRFPGEKLDPATNGVALPATVRFDAPQRTLPFGKLAFDDLMYLPGTVVIQCFGHEVQMLPRTLYLDRASHEWTDGAVHVLEAAGKPANLDPPPKRKPFSR